MMFLNSTLVNNVALFLVPIFMSISSSSSFAHDELVTTLTGSYKLSYQSKQSGLKFSGYLVESHSNDVADQSQIIDPDSDYESAIVMAVSERQEDFIDPSADTEPYSGTPMEMGDFLDPDASIQDDSYSGKKIKDTPFIDPDSDNIESSY
jgi:hypothetical protein